MSKNLNFNDFQKYEDNDASFKKIKRKKKIKSNKQTNDVRMVKKNL